jgi:hypothetical protein
MPEPFSRCRLSLPWQPPFCPGCQDELIPGQFQTKKAGLSEGSSFGNPAVSASKTRGFPPSPHGELGFSGESRTLYKGSDSNNDSFLD